MNFKTTLIAASVACCGMLALATSAYAFCGVIEKSASAKRTQVAVQRADAMMRKDVRKLRREYGAKLQLDEPQKSCIGGALAIDANGNELTGPSSCKVTLSFCVNP